MKRFHYDQQLQVYMYALIYLDPETKAEEDCFPATTKLLQTTKNYQLQDQSQNIGLNLVTYVQKILNLI